MEGTSQKEHSQDKSKTSEDSLEKIDGCYLPPAYKIFAEGIKNFEVFNSDIWICSFPRSGTTWMSEMVWLIANNCDFEKAKASMFERIRFIDMGFLFHDHKNPQKNSFETITDPINYAKNQPEPRVIKTHLPFHLLPQQIQSGQKQPKIVYICRNPMDVCVSYYYHLASIMFDGNLEKYCELFLKGEVLYGPYWDNVFPFWRIRNQPNVLFLKYEDMKADLSKEIRKTATFLRKTVSNVQIEKLVKHLSFESMKKNEAINGGKLMEFIKSGGSIYSPFVRSGVVGGYQKEMDKALITKYQKWINDNLKGTELTF